MNDSAQRSTQSPIRSLLLWSLIWLPLCFSIWFYLAQLFVAPSGLLLGALLPKLAPQVFLELVQTGYVYEIQTFVPFVIRQGADAGKTGALAITVNPMIYAYGLPLLAGLVLATPLTVARRAVQIGVGIAAMTLVQAWGAGWEALKTVGFGLGMQGVVLVEQQGISRELIALCYQFGYLILPAVVPVGLWLGMNRRFIQSLVERPR